MTGRFMWVTAVFPMCPHVPEAKPAAFHPEMGNYKALNPSGLFPPQPVMRVAGQDTKRNCREERLKKIEALIYSCSLTPFLLFCASTVLIIWKKQTLKLENPFLTSVTKTLAIY